MFHHTPSFPIQIQHIHDDHSLTYSSADSEEDVFSLDGAKMLEEDNHDADSRGGESASMNTPSPSSFVELEQSIHELEKCYAQCIKISPQKEGTGVRDVKSNEDNAEMMIQAKVLLKRKEANRDSNVDPPGLKCSSAQELPVKQNEMLFKRQCLLLQGKGSHKNRSNITGFSVVSVPQHEVVNHATKDEDRLKHISLLATKSSRASNESDLLTNDNA